MRIRAHERLMAASRLFSSAVLQELARKGRSPQFSQLIRLAEINESASSDSPIAEAFDRAFSLLQGEGARDEYVYKSALVQRIALGTHSLRTASVLSEFRVGECKADLAILNGTSTVYEVKSERDSLTRLERQLSAYGHVFSRVYVITAENHLKEVLNVAPENVGVMRLNRRFQISVVRGAVDDPDRVSPAAIFDSLRTEEAKQVLIHCGRRPKPVPNTELSSSLRKEFIHLGPRQAHEGMVAVLKRTRSQHRLKDLLVCLPTSLHTAALSAPLRQSDHERLVTALGTSLEEAMAWG